VAVEDRRTLQQVVMAPTVVDLLNQRKSLTELEVGTMTD
jgi:hypothetical protein